MGTRRARPPKPPRCLLCFCRPQLLVGLTSAAGCSEDPEHPPPTAERHPQHPLGTVPMQGTRHPSCISQEKIKAWCEKVVCVPCHGTRRGQHGGALLFLSFLSSALKSVATTQPLMPTSPRCQSPSAGPGEPVLAEGTAPARGSTVELVGLTAASHSACFSQGNLWETELISLLKKPSNPPQKGFGTRRG